MKRMIFAAALCAATAVAAPAAFADRWVAPINGNVSDGHRHESRPQNLHDRAYLPGCVEHDDPGLQPQLTPPPACNRRAVQ
jgi:hypothetical protein